MAGNGHLPGSLLWWRSAHPRFRVWALLGCPLIYLLIVIYIWISVVGSPSSQGICLSAIIFGAIIQPGPPQAEQQVTSPDHPRATEGLLAQPVDRVNRRAPRRRETLGWIGRSLGRWLIAVRHRSPLRRGGAGPRRWPAVPSIPSRITSAFTLVFVWPGMAVYLALLWWRSPHPNFRAWAILASPIIYLLLIYVWIAIFVEPTTQGICLSAIVFGAIIPRAPRRQIS